MEIKVTYYDEEKDSFIEFEQTVDSKDTKNIYLENSDIKTRLMALVDVRKGKKFPHISYIDAEVVIEKDGVKEYGYVRLTIDPKRDHEQQSSNIVQEFLKDIFDEIEEAVQELA